MKKVITKLELAGNRVKVDVSEASVLIVNIFEKLGCPIDVSQTISYKKWFV